MVTLLGHVMSRLANGCNFYVIVKQSFFLSSMSHFIPYKGKKDENRRSTHLRRTIVGRTRRE